MIEKLTLFKNVNTNLISLIKKIKIRIIKLQALLLLNEKLTDST